MNAKQRKVNLKKRKRYARFKEQRRAAAPAAAAPARTTARRATT